MPMPLSDGFVRQGELASSWSGPAAAGGGDCGRSGRRRSRRPVSRVRAARCGRVSAAPSSALRSSVAMCGCRTVSRGRETLGRSGVHLRQLVRASYPGFSPQVRTCTEMCAPCPSMHTPLQRQEGVCEPGLAHQLQHDEIALREQRSCCCCCGLGPIDIMPNARDQQIRQPGGETERPRCHRAVHALAEQCARRVRHCRACNPHQGVRLKRLCSSAASSVVLTSTHNGPAPSLCGGAGRAGAVCHGLPRVPGARQLPVPAFRPAAARLRPLLPGLVRVPALDEPISSPHVKRLPCRRRHTHSGVRICPALLRCALRYTRVTLQPGAGDAADAPTSLAFVLGFTTPPQDGARFLPPLSRGVILPLTSAFTHICAP